MQKELNKIKTEALKRVEKVKNSKELDLLAHDYLGKKGKITQVLRSLGDLSQKERPIIGKLANEIKKEIDIAIKNKEGVLYNKEESEKIKKESLDVTFPGWKIKRGNVHPVIRTLNEIDEIFIHLGYSIARGPDVETEFNNFEALNIPKDHPARDMWDTFYIRESRVEDGESKKDKLLLRTHTSPVQIRVMQKQKPPIKIIAPGRVYRRDNDLTHSPEFYQVEGLLIDENTTFADLKGTLEVFLHRFFGEERKIQFRPSFFPFTEPSAEVDVECIICRGKGCNVCKNTGWLEILGAGMVDPFVLEKVNISSQKYQGFAFGMGVERMAMLKYGIDDIRLFYENDVRFIEQFK